MAIMTCIYCHAENAQDEQLCRECFRKLPVPPPAPSPSDPTPLVTGPPTAASPASPASPGRTPAIESPAPATDQASTTDQPPATDQSATTETPANCPHCGEEVPDPRNQVCVECHRPLSHAGPLRLRFLSGEVLVDLAQSVPLGRDPTSSPVADLFADRDNISRLHATVGVDDNGAWVRDEKSLNGTYVNDVPVPPGTRIGLADGDTLRLAANVTTVVRIISHETQ